MHGWKNYPYVGYGHQLQRGEHFTANMTERQADSLLRADLWKCFEHFKGYGKDALLLTLLAYNVGVGRLLGYGKYSKSRLLRKIEAGDRNFYWEYKWSICYFVCHKTNKLAHELDWHRICIYRMLNFNYFCNGRH